MIGTIPSDSLEKDVLMAIPKYDELIEPLFLAMKDLGTPPLLPNKKNKLEKY